MRLLLIAYEFPPIVSAQSLRWGFLVRELAGREDTYIDVLTIKLPSVFGHELFDYNQFKNLTIHRILPGPFENIFFKGKVYLNLSKDVLIRKKRSFRITKKIYRGLRRVLDHVLIPDIRTEWLFPALFYAIKKMEVKKYDFIITSHEPGVDSLIGVFLKKFYKTAWVADFGDPFLAPYTPKWRTYIDKAIEKKIYENADLIVTVNEQIRDYILGRMKIRDDKDVIVIPQGFYEIHEPRYNRNNVFTITYTGTFYKGFRDPREFAKALIDLNHKGIKLRFILAGRNEWVIPYFKGGEDWFVFKGEVSPWESMVLQKTSDILLYITNKDPLQTPGKIYEYLGSCRPILCILYNNNDPVSQLIKESRRGIVVSNRSHIIEDSILKLHKLHQESTLDRNFATDFDSVRKFSWQHLAEILAAALERRNG
jgi:hypothetical protein